MTNLMKRLPARMHATSASAGTPLRAKGQKARGPISPQPIDVRPDPESLANRPSTLERSPHVADQQDENHEVQREQRDQAISQDGDRSFLLQQQAKSNSRVVPRNGAALVR